jgi:NNP family nitrate/nitrite transporter-like MFS transporter
MPIIRNDLGLSKDQLANINIAAVMVTILVRLIVGPLCDKYGARLTYTWLLVLGAMPVMGIAFTHSYAGFLLLRLCIGAIGASFVITQLHTSSMFAPNVVGTANATVAGWGNAGGGATQALMPLLVAAIVSLGIQPSMGWRIAMFVPGLMMLIMAVFYCRCATDTPQGNLRDLPHHDAAKAVSGWQSFTIAARDYRVWMLFVTYGACFGVELTIHNVASLYFVDRFALDVNTAGLYVGCFGLLALFARALGGLVSDRLAHGRGLDGRTRWLFLLILGEGMGLILFAHADSARLAFITMIVFGLFTHMACGATYSLTPFINHKAKGGVSGIIGAGGNVGAVLAGFLMKGSTSTQQGLLTLGVLVILSGFCAIAVRFGVAHQTAEREAYAAALEHRQTVAAQLTTPATKAA